MTNRTDRAKNAGEAHFLTSAIQAQKVAGLNGEAGIIIRQSTKNAKSFTIAPS